METLENRQGHKIACLEEIALRNGWFSDAALEAAATHSKNDYCAYLKDLLQDETR